MRKAYFPQWYINKFEKKEEKYYKSFTLILIVIVFIFSIITLNNLSTYKGLINESNNTVDEETINANNKLTLETFTNIKQSIINSPMKTRSIIVDANVVTMNIDLEDRNEYLSDIKHLEHCGDIIYISNIIESDNGKYFEVKVKIKNEDD
ncbi:hypothetical protein [Clostridium sp.]|uniref:hypothetical protein n=1 Tax=Clostridium sp. TaxID=1506 RepID=UPI002FC86596